MGFLDRFRRKKVVLIQEEKEVDSVPVSERYHEAMVQPPPASTSSMKVVSKGRALKTLKRKKKVKKKRVMKRRSHAKPRRHTQGVRGNSTVPSKAGEGSTHKWMHKERTLLDAALRDLDRELSGLRSSRRKLESKIAELSDNLGSTQTKEISLRNQISELMKKEATLTKKKTSTKDKLVDIDQKIEKVRAIQADLKSV